MIHNIIMLVLNNAIGVGTIVWKRKRLGGCQGTVIGHVSKPLDIGTTCKGEYRVRWDDGTKEDKKTNQLKKELPTGDPVFDMTVVLT